jgi:hypothetical protein
MTGIFETAEKPTGYALSCAGIDNLYNNVIIEPSFRVNIKNGGSHEKGIDWTYVSGAAVRRSVLCSCGR